MPGVPTRVASRLAAGLKTFHPILTSAKARDVNEADTVTIVKDMLAEILGFDKYSEVTSEYSIRGTFVDLALKVDGKLHILIEVKAIGQALEDRHTRQAVDYGANQGIEWVVLTNGVHWRTFKVNFGKPISQELVMDLDVLTLNPRNASHLEALFPLTKEGIVKSALQAHHEQRQATNRYVLGAILQTDPVLDVIRREVRRMSPNVKIDSEDIRDLLVQEVMKREVVEGERAADARAKVRRAATRRLRVLAANADKPPTPLVHNAPAPPDA